MKNDSNPIIRSQEVTIDMHICAALSESRGDFLSGARRIHQGCDKEPTERTGFIDQKVFHELHYATSESATPTWRISASS